MGRIKSMGRSIINTGKSFYISKLAIGQHDQMSVYVLLLPVLVFVLKCGAAFLAILCFSLCPWQTVGVTQIQMGKG